MYSQTESRQHVAEFHYGFETSGASEVAAMQMNKVVLLASVKHPHGHSTMVVTQLLACTEAVIDKLPVEAVLWQLVQQPTEDQQHVRM